MGGAGDAANVVEQRHEQRLGRGAGELAVGAGGQSGACAQGGWGKTASDIYSEEKKIAGWRGERGSVAAANGNHSGRRHRCCCHRWRRAASRSGRGASAAAFTACRGCPFSVVRGVEGRRPFITTTASKGHKKRTSPACTSGTGANDRWPRAGVLVKTGAPAGQHSPGRSRRGSGKKAGGSPPHDDVARSSAQRNHSCSWCERAAGRRPQRQHSHHFSLL